MVLILVGIDKGTKTFTYVPNRTLIKENLEGVAIPLPLGKEICYKKQPG